MKSHDSTKRSKWKKYRKVQMAMGILGLVAVFLPLINSSLMSVSAWDVYVFVFNNFETIVDASQHSTALSEMPGGLGEQAGLYSFITFMALFSMAGMPIDRIVRWFSNKANPGYYHSVTATLFLLIVGSRVGFDHLGTGIWVWAVASFGGTAIYHHYEDTIERFAETESDWFEDTSRNTQNDPTKNVEYNAVDIGYGEYKCQECGGDFKEKKETCKHCGAELNYDPDADVGDATEGSLFGAKQKLRAALVGIPGAMLLLLVLYSVGSCVTN